MKYENYKSDNTLNIHSRVSAKRVIQSKTGLETNPKFTKSSAKHYAYEPNKEYSNKEIDEAFEKALENNANLRDNFYSETGAAITTVSRTRDRLSELKSERINSNKSYEEQVKDKSLYVPRKFKQLGEDSYHSVRTINRNFKRNKDAKNIKYTVDEYKYVNGYKIKKSSAKKIKKNLAIESKKPNGKQAKLASKNRRNAIYKLAGKKIKSQNNRRQSNYILDRLIMSFTVKSRKKKNFSKVIIAIGILISILLLSICGLVAIGVVLSKDYSIPEALTMSQLCVEYEDYYSEYLFKSIVAQCDPHDDSFPLLVGSTKIKWRNVLAVYFAYEAGKEGGSKKNVEELIKSGGKLEDQHDFNKVFLTMNGIKKYEVVYDIPSSIKLQKTWDKDPEATWYKVVDGEPDKIEREDTEYKTVTKFIVYHVSPEYAAQKLFFNPEQYSLLQKYLSKKYDNYFFDIEEMMYSKSNDKIVKLALEQVGQGPYKYLNKYGDGDPHQWCVIFVYYCMRELGYGEKVFPKTASTGEVLKWYKNSRNPGYVIYPSQFNKDTDTIKPGWLIIKKTSVSSHGHTSIIAWYDKKKQEFHTVDGNQSGNIVKTNTYGWDKVTAICVPNYPDGENNEKKPFDRNRDYFIDIKQLPANYVKSSQKAKENCTDNIKDAGLEIEKNLLEYGIN